MYKLTAVAAFLLILVVSANAQQSPGKILKRFEFVAGSSFSNNNGYEPEYESKAGYGFGFGYYQPLSKSFSINVRALYERKGSVLNSKSSWPIGDEYISANTEYNSKFNYLTFYLLPTFQIGRSKKIYLSAGGYYSILHKYSINTHRTNVETGEVTVNYTTTDKDYLDPHFDAGVSFQAGYAFNVSKKVQLIAQAFINRGLVDIKSSPIDGSQRNNTFGLSLSARMR